MTVLGQFNLIFLLVLNASMQQNDPCCGKTLFIGVLGKHDPITATAQAKWEWGRSGDNANGLLVMRHASRSLPNAVSN